MLFPHNGSRYGQVLALAPTGKAALNINGRTVDSGMHLFELKSTSEMSEPLLRRLQDELGGVKLIIADEMSMAGLYKTGQMDMEMKYSAGKHGSPMGGVHFVFVTDFYQLPPVMDKLLYTRQTAGLNIMETNGRYLYQICSTFVELAELMGQVWVSASDQLFRRSLQRNRLGICTDEDTLLNKERTAVSLEGMQLPTEALFVAPTRDICQQTNGIKLNNLILSGSERACM